MLIVGNDLCFPEEGSPPGGLLTKYLSLALEVLKVVHTKHPGSCLSVLSGQGWARQSETGNWGLGRGRLPWVWSQAGLGWTGPGQMELGTEQSPGRTH